MCSSLSFHAVIHLGNTQSPLSRHRNAAAPSEGAQSPAPAPRVPGSGVLTTQLEAERGPPSRGHGCPDSWRPRQSLAAARVWRCEWGADGGRTRHQREGDGTGGEGTRKNGRASAETPAREGVAGGKPSSPAPPAASGAPAPPHAGGATSSGDVSLRRHIGKAPPPPPPSRSSGCLGGRGRSKEGSLRRPARPPRRRPPPHACPRPRCRQRPDLTRKPASGAEEGDPVGPASLSARRGASAGAMTSLTQRSSGLVQRRTEASRSAADKERAAGGGGGGGEDDAQSRRDEQDDDDKGDSKETRLTLMEEVLLLGLKDREPVGAVFSILIFEALQFCKLQELSGLHIILE
uniref:Golgi phosphoprotein 3 n=1 Tax=Equus caballus TaxID=9796 RepID=A0A9L0R882_HORSE